MNNEEILQKIVILESRLEFIKEIKTEMIFCDYENAMVKNENYSEYDYSYEVVTIKSEIENLIGQLG